MHTVRVRHCGGTIAHRRAELGRLCLHRAWIFNVHGPVVTATLPRCRNAFHSAATVCTARADAAIDTLEAGVALTVAYSGPGAYSETAVKQLCPDCQALPCERYEIAFQAVSQWLADRAVVPIETDQGGSLHSVYDLLLKYQLHIVGETTVLASHCLLGLPGASKSDIKRVLSHPHALVQCDNYLRQLNVVRESVESTAGAAQAVAKAGQKDLAAIGSERAAELYNLSVLDKGINDKHGDMIRFIELARDPHEPPRITQDGNATKYKTSIAFSLKQGPGQLFRALSVLALRDINMTKIESRPARAAPIVQAPGLAEQHERRYNYLFYVDFAGSVFDANCSHALRHLKEVCPFVRVLGSYPSEL